MDVSVLSERFLCEFIIARNLTKTKTRFCRNVLGYLVPQSKIDHIPRRSSIHVKEKVGTDLIASTHITQKLGCANTSNPFIRFGVSSVELLPKLEE
jgi:hypothetical protein